MSPTDLHTHREDLQRQARRLAGVYTEGLPGDHERVQRILGLLELEDQLVQLDAHRAIHPATRPLPLTDEQMRQRLAGGLVLAAAFPEDLGGDDSQADDPATPADVDALLAPLGIFGQALPEAPEWTL